MAFGLLTVVGFVGTSYAQQETRVFIDAGISHARPPADVDIEPGTYGLLGGRFVAGPAFGSLYGGLASDPDVADWVGGQLGLWVQSAGTERLGWAVTGLASAFALGDPTPYKAAMARLIPEARVSAGKTSVILRGYGGIGRSDVTDTSSDPDSSIISDLWMYGGGLEISQSLGGVRVWTGADAYESAGGTYLTAYVRSVGPLLTGLWGAGFALWDTPTGVEPTFSISLSLPLAPRWSAELSVGRSGPDPLLNSPAAVDGSFVVSWTAYAPSVPQPLVTIAGDEAKEAFFRLKYDGADTVSLIGDFSGWEPIAMRREDGYWVVGVPVQPGLYHFGFLVDGEWHVPESAPGRVTDEFGQINATLVVPER